MLRRREDRIPGGAEDGTLIGSRQEGDMCWCSRRPKCRYVWTSIQRHLPAAMIPPETSPPKHRSKPVSLRRVMDLLFDLSSSRKRCFESLFLRTPAKAN